MNKIKLQITLPQMLVEKIDKDAQSTYTSKSLWFEKVVTLYFENNEKTNVNRTNKRINLEI